MEPERYDFIYESLGRFLLLFIPPAALYLLLTFVVAPALAPQFTGNQLVALHSAVCLVVGVTFFVLLRKGLRRFYVLTGICTIYEDRVELQMGSNTKVMPFIHIAKVSHQMRGRHAGDYRIIIATNNKAEAKSINIETLPRYEHKYPGITTSQELWDILRARKGRFDKYGTALTPKSPPKRRAR